MIVAARARPVLAHASQNHSLESGGGHGVLPLSKELLVIESYWERESLGSFVCLFSFVFVFNLISSLILWEFHSMYSNSAYLVVPHIILLPLPHRPTRENFKN